jgi:hypothetical protein
MTGESPDHGSLPDVQQGIMDPEVNSELEKATGPNTYRMNKKKKKVEYDSVKSSHANIEAIKL